jgi:hypothetical protein
VKSLLQPAGRLSSPPSGRTCAAGQTGPCNPKSATTGWLPNELPQGHCCIGDHHKWAGWVDASSPTSSVRTEIGLRLARFPPGVITLAVRSMPLSWRFELVRWRCGSVSEMYGVSSVERPKEYG